MSKYNRLAGLKEAIREGFEHTNPARVNMSKDEEEKNLYPVSERDIKTLKNEEEKNLYPVSERDIKTLKNEKD